MSIDMIIDESVRISQPDTGFRFGVDSVILAWFATLKRSDSVIEIGGGSGVISVLLARLKDAQKITAVELQPIMFEHLQESIALNGLTDIIKPVLTDVRNYEPEEKFTLAICNPPYRPINIGKVSAGDSDLAARFEQTLTIDDILNFGKRYIHYGGRLAFCGDADRLIPAINACSSSMFQPKRLRFLHAGKARSARIFFMECVYGGGVELSIEPPIVQEGDFACETYSNILMGKWKR